MAHQVALTKNHKRILLEALLESQSIKERKLKSPESIYKMNAMYADAAEKLLTTVECGKMGYKSTDNIFGWMIDQIHHSGKLSETEFGQLAINICKAAGDGQYESFCRMTIANTLFE